MSKDPSTPNQDDSLRRQALGEQISAYLDGELTAVEVAEVEQLLAEDPAARDRLENFRSLRVACQQDPIPVFDRDLSQVVMAEALRRQASGDLVSEQQRVELPDRLEPDGDFGLPFGASSRNWAWAVVAAAAAVLIAFQGRPEAPSAPALRAGQLAKASLPQHLRAMQHAVPGVQVVNFHATPDKLARLRQRLALQSAKPAQLPGEFMAVSQKGLVVEPGESTLLPESGEQLLYLDAEEAELDRLLRELSTEEEGSLVQVEPNPPKTRPVPKPQVTGKPGIRAVPLRVKVSPEQLSALLKQRAASAGPGQRRFIVLRIHRQPQP